MLLELVDQAAIWRLKWLQVDALWLALDALQ
jgi:hypothetical protein